MKTYSKTNGYIIRGGAVAVLVLSVLAGFLTPATQNSAKVRSLSFADRIAYQRVIEDVYWRHRIWPKENAKPKPSLDEVMSAEQIEKKVEDYLRDSQALETYWQKPIAPQQLQAEMERMAQNTKQPEVLRELFEALGNDPSVIAECLGRPVLTERLVADLSVHDKSQRFALLRVQAVGSKFNITTSGKATYALPEIDPCTDDTWAPTSLTNAPDGRRFHTAVWTGSEMVVWGGRVGAVRSNTGGRYNPSTDSWTATSLINAPDGRFSHTAVWTGSEMIVWSGVGFGYVNTGGRYSPGTDSWIATSTTNAPAGRQYHTAVWTGSEMIVWGGVDANGPTYFNTGGRYNAGTDSWTATSTTNAPAARDLHTAVWTDSQMIVWGGFDANGPTYFNTGGRYNAGTDSWTATSTTSVPDGRSRPTAVWTDSEMIVWGGGNDITAFNTGGRYNPDTDSWTATSTTSAASARSVHTAVWTGSEMIVWGGVDANGPTYLNTGGRYNPGTDSWIATSTTNAPAGRELHTAVWTDSQMIVWGGDNGGPYLNTGGRYCAATPTPTPTPTPCTGRCAPTPRPRPTPAPRP
jgi:N-acetylneuraminic acid mutarotase